MIQIAQCGVHMAAKPIGVRVGRAPADCGGEVGQRLLEGLAIVRLW